MSTHQVSKPRAAKKSIAENSLRPGTCRSKVGCEAIDEPCTNRMVPRVCAGSPAHFSHMNSFTSLPLLVQCSSPRIAALGVTGLFIVMLRLLRSRGLCTGTAEHAATLGVRGRRRRRWRAQADILGPNRHVHILTRAGAVERSRLDHEILGKLYRA